MKKIISSHNMKIIQKNEISTPKCNCHKYPCPLEGNCQIKNVIYQATVQSENDTQTYVGLTSSTFKARWSNHKTGFEHEKHRKDTTLSKYIWELKDKKTEYDVTWKIIGRANPFSPISKVCNLCTLEKWFILFKPNIAKLNKKEELGNYCLHKASILLDKT